MDGKELYQVYDDGWLVSFGGRERGLLAFSTEKTVSKVEGRRKGIEVLKIKQRKI